MRIIGLDVHRTFAEVAIRERGGVHSAGRLGLTRRELQGFARGLTHEDVVVLEATTNALAIARLLQAAAGQVVISNPLRTRMIAEAKVKTDKLDAAMLTQLYAAEVLPAVRIPDEQTALLRRQVARRAQLVRARTQLKNQLHAILHRNLLPRCPAADLFGRKGRAWLARQPLPADEQTTVASLLRALDHAGEELAEVERALAQGGLNNEAAQRLMTIPGIDYVVALGIVAAVGAIERFGSPQKLVSYLGLNPSVRQSGLRPAHHGRISKQGCAHARGVLVEAAWTAVRTPGPLRAFFLRLRARRGGQIAVVAAARKLAVIVWHLLTKREDYAWARPSLTEQKRRTLELRAGQPAQRGQPGRARGYNLHEVRARERALSEQAERAYQQLTSHWRPRRPPQRTGATREARR